MSSSAATYLVLVTVALSVTYLSFLMYSAYGLGAVKAAAPFVGTVALVFGECQSRTCKESEAVRALVCVCLPRERGSCHRLG